MTPQSTSINCPYCGGEFAVTKERASSTCTYRCRCPKCERSFMVEDKGDLPRAPAEGSRKGRDHRDMVPDGVPPPDKGRPSARRMSWDSRPVGPPRDGKDRGRGSRAPPSLWEDRAEDRISADMPHHGPWSPRRRGEPTEGEGRRGEAGTGLGPGPRGKRGWPTGPGASVLSERAGPPPPVDRRSGAQKKLQRRRIQPRVLLSPTSVAAILLTLTFVLGVVNAFVFTPSEADVDRPRDIFSESSATLAGKVFDGETGVALADADVSLVGTDISTTTNAEGWFFLYDLTDGEYTLRAELDGYGTVTRKITFESATPDSQDIDMREGGDPVEEDRSSPLLDPPSRRPEVVGYLMGVLSVPPLLGAVFCLRRERFVIALIGAVLGCFSLGFGFGSGMSMAAVVLILVARERFDAEGDGREEAIGPVSGDRRGGGGEGSRGGKKGPSGDGGRPMVGEVGPWRGGKEGPGDGEGTSPQ